MQLDGVNQQALEINGAIAILEKKPNPVPGEMRRGDIKFLHTFYAALESRGGGWQIEPRLAPCTHNVSGLYKADPCKKENRSKDN
jgi:hypothetical protein